MRPHSRPTRRRIDLSSVASRRPMGGLVAAYSGARMEEAVLDDGRRLVLKHLPITGDWLTRATMGAGRLRTLWESGLLDRVGLLVDHTILDVVLEGGTDVVVMRDARKELLPPVLPVTRDTSRALLRGLAAMHDGLVGQPPMPLCSVAARYGMFAPAHHAGKDEGAAPHPLAKSIVTGWELFAAHAAPAVAEAVFAVQADPDLLGRRLERFPATLLHGDAKLENLGVGPAGLVAIDWGELTGFGPPEIDVAWYALQGSHRIGCTPQEVFDDYQEARGRPLDPEVLDLVCIGSLAQIGFRFAAAAYGSESTNRDAATSQLRWWTARVHTALERVGPL